MSDRNTSGITPARLWTKQGAFEQYLHVPPAVSDNQDEDLHTPVAPLDDWLRERFFRHSGNADVIRRELASEHGIVIGLRSVELRVQRWRQELWAQKRATVTVAIAGRVACIDQSGGHARRKHLALPVAMLLVGDQARVFPCKNTAKALEHGLIRKPVAARRQAVLVFAVLFVGFRIPCAAANPFDQFGTDAISFDGQRVIASVT